MPQHIRKTLSPYLSVLLFVGFLVFAKDGLAQQDVVPGTSSNEQAKALAEAEQKEPKEKPQKRS